MSGELKKLYIQAYTKDDYQTKIEDLIFTTYINPESYSIKYAAKHDDNQAAGTSGASAKFSKIVPQELDLEFMLDRTGAIGTSATLDKKFVNDTSTEGGTEKESSYTDTGVMTDIDLFKKVALNINGEEHQPNFLKIVWGALIFKGVIADMEVSFKLFKPDGAPIRAVIKAKFIGSIDTELRVAQDKMASPDLTHIRTVKEGDKLPLMTKNIYGDSKYYLEVARVNKLVNFRKLEPGQRIFFPPIDKLKN